MVDGFKTGCLALDVALLACILGVELDGRSAIYATRYGLIFGFILQVDADTGELRYTCSVRGSFHVFKNHGINNADRFYFSQFYHVCEELYSQFLIKPEITIMQSLEFGINLRLPFATKRVFDAIKDYKGKPFITTKLGIEYKSTLYTLKIYDKSRKYAELGVDNILRVEIRAKCSYLRRRGLNIRLMDSLLDVNNWIQFENILLEAIDDITMIEFLSIEGMSKKEKGLYEAFTSDKWKEYNKHKLCRERKKFAKLSIRLGATNFKGEFKRMIQKECETLRDANVDFRNRINTLEISESNPLINEINIRGVEEKAVFATESTFLNDEAEEHFRNQINIKIKVDSVAKTSQPTAPTQPGKDPPLFASKISDSIQIRGKPTDYESKSI